MEFQPENSIREGKKVLRRGTQRSYLLEKQVGTGRIICRSLEIRNISKSGRRGKTKERNERKMGGYLKFAPKIENMFNEEKASLGKFRPKNQFSCQVLNSATPKGQGF